MTAPLHEGWTPMTQDEIDGANADHPAVAAAREGGVRMNDHLDALPDDADPAPVRRARFDATPDEQMDLDEVGVLGRSTAEMD